MYRFIVRLIIAVILAFGLIYLPPVREYLVGPFTEGITMVAGLLIALFGGTVTLSGNVLSIPGFSVEVMDMCNGVEATVILWVAILSFPAPAVHKLNGLVIGTLTVHGLNIVRIISLLYLGAFDEIWFHWFHKYFWDAVIMLDILVVFLVWLRLIPLAVLNDDVFDEIFPGGGL